MTTRDRLVLIGVIVLVVLAGGYLLVVSPEHKQAVQEQAQVQSARQQLETAETQAATARSAQQRYTVAYSSVVSLGKAVPPSEEVPSLIYELDQASNQRDVDFNSIVTGAAGGSSSSSSSRSSSAATAAAAPAGFTQMPFTFVFKGSFEGLAHLLGQVDSFVQRKTNGEVLVSGRLLTIQGADISVENSAGAGALTATITATAYVLPASQGLTGGAPSTLPGAPSSTSSSSAPTTAAVVRVNP